MNTNKKLNFFDIAKLSKTSLGSVSRFFNGTKVSLKTKTKIEKVLQEYDYEPNYGAQLIKGKDTSIYLIVPTWNDSIANHILKAVQQKVNEINSNLFVVQGSFDSNIYLKTLKEVIRRKANKIILLLPEINQELVGFIQNLHLSKKAKISVYGKVISNVPSVTIDDQTAVYDLTYKLIENNNKTKIAYIGLDETDLTTGKLRLKGFLKAVKKVNHLKYKTFLITPTVYRNNTYQEINLMLPYLIKFNPDIIVCGTHNIYKEIKAKKEQINYKKITDIGYISNSDYELDYCFKIFIDYHLIGILLFNNFDDNKKVLKQKIKPNLIKAEE